MSKLCTCSFKKQLCKLTTFLLFSRDRDESGLGNVVSNATLSKTIFPSIRIGWIECTEAMVKRLTDR